MKIYDLKLGQKTKILDEWNEIGIDYNKLPLILLIIQHLIYSINPFYKSRTLNCIQVFLQKYPHRRKNFGLRNNISLENIRKYKREKH